MTRALKIAFVMDAMEKVQPFSDTSFAFMLAAQKRGHSLLHVGAEDVSLEHNAICLHGQRLEVNHQENDFYSVLAEETWREVDAIFIRLDPPFNEAYLTLTWLLSFAEDQGIRVINSPRGLRNANEHLYSLVFPEICPKTLISARKNEILDFVQSVGGNAIAKPIDGHAGFGVVRLKSKDDNINALIGMLTLEGSQPTMIQQYLPEGAQGDRRLLLVDGKLRGVVHRKPAIGDLRANLHVGGSAESTQITQSDQAIADTIGQRLKEDGLFFVGADVIGGKLIEINVTSPTLVQEFKALGGTDLADEVITALEK